VQPSYRLGLIIVVEAILVSWLITYGFIPSAPAPAPAGQNLGAASFDVGSFKLTERSGKTVTNADLNDGVWIASFIFTRCPSSCPRITQVVRDLHNGPLKASGVKFVSISVDPEYDTPEVLSRYAKTRDADPNRWLFLTGPKDDIYQLILERFHLSVAQNPEADPKKGVEAVAHSDKLALIDRGNKVIGLFASDDPESLKNLIAKAKQRAGLSIPWVRSLPPINACLNGSCAVLLAIGFVLIHNRRPKGHALCMISGVVVSAIFLSCYLVYHYFVGSVSFQGTGPIRIVYFTILISHTLLATFGVVPLVSFTLIRAIRKQFDRHAQIARVTFPIWMYVSVTGVIIYWMLYQMDVPQVGAIG
jgi:protein SCO1/2/putative membrane protein